MPQVGPDACLSNEFDLVITFHLPHIGDVLLDANVCIDDRRKRGTRVPVSCRASVGIDRNRPVCNSELITHFSDQFHWFALRIVEIRRYVIDQKIVSRGVLLL